MNKEKSCGAVVYKRVNNDYLFLVIKQRAGHYSFPKGHVEKNESEEETAYREILEETGIKVKLNLNFRSVITYSPKAGIIKDVVYFIAEYASGKEVPQESEVSDVFWANKSEVLSLITFENSRKVFEKVVNYLEKSNK